MSRISINAAPEHRDFLLAKSRNEEFYARGPIRITDQKSAL